MEWAYSGGKQTMTTIITSLPIMLGIMFIIAAGVTLVVFVIYWLTRSGKFGGRDNFADGGRYTPYGDHGTVSGSYDSDNHHSHGHSSHHDSGGGHHGHSNDGGSFGGPDGGSSGGGDGGGGGGDGGGGS